MQSTNFRLFILIATRIPSPEDSTPLQPRIFVEAINQGVCKALDNDARLFQLVESNMMKERTLPYQRFQLRTVPICQSWLGNS
jgi:hypothetical protein